MVGVVLLAVAGVSAQVALVRGHPLGQGSISSSLGLGSSCNGFKPTATMLRCNEVAFVPGVLLREEDLDDVELLA